MRRRGQLAGVEIKVRVGDDLYFEVYLLKIHRFNMDKIYITGNLICK